MALDPKRAFVVILLIGIFTLAARNIEDPDFWWHLRTGQYIVETHAVPHVDPFSFTRHGEPWVAHEWLSEIFIYGLYRVAGWGGLITAFALFTATTFLFLYLRCSGKPYLAGLIVLWGAFACRSTWGVRPQTISVLLASSLLWVLETSGRGKRRLWAIVPMMLLWANLHAGYELGIALMICFLIGGWLDNVLGRDIPDRSRPNLRALALVLMLSLAVVVLNPNGWQLYTYPLATFRSTAMQSHIAEWFSPDFHKPEYLPLVGMLLALPVLLSLAPRRISVRSVLLLCASTYAALQSIRLIPIFVLIAVPELVAQADAWLEARRKAPSAIDARHPRLLRSVSNGALVVAITLFSGMQVRRVIRYQPQVESRVFPSAAVEFLQQQPLTGPLFNDYDWGGYLVWKLYPEQPVFIDGRADLYGNQLMEQFSNAYNLVGNWSETLDRWNIQTVLIPPQSALAAALSTNSRWKVVFRGEQAIVLRRIAEPGPRPTS